MSDDKILRFPGSGADAKAKPGAAPVFKGPMPSPEEALALLQGLSEDQQKALQLVMSGMAFVLVAIKPAERGADFFTAMHGEPADLRNAQPHLPGVIDRLYSRKGI